MKFTIVRYSVVKVHSPIKCNTVQSIPTCLCEVFLYFISPNEDMDEEEVEAKRKPTNNEW